MVEVIYAHGGGWHPSVPAAVALAALALWGARRARAQRYLFWGGLGALVIALLSPLDALSHSWASAHMVQHLVLITLAAPLLVAAGVGGALWARWGSTAAGHPLVLAAVHSAVLWFWHASGPYDAALSDQQLAGVIMWVPGGGAYLVAALMVLLQAIGRDERARGWRFS